MKKAIKNIRSASELLKDFIVNISRKAIFLVGFIVALSINFVVRPWVETDNYWDVYWDITRAVKERFDAEGVSIPFPQRDVHVHQLSTA